MSGCLHTMVLVAGPPPSGALRVQPAEPCRLGDTLHRDDLGSQARIDPVGRRSSPDRVSRREALAEQSIVDSSSVHASAARFWAHSK